MATLYVYPISYQNTYFFPIPRIEYSRIQLPENQTPNREPIFISWAFPPEGFIKINTDGSFMLNSGLAGFGGVARDDKGRWLGGFYGRLSMVATSSLTTELWAINGGLTVAKNYNLKNVIIETDSSEALKLLTVRNNVSKSHTDRVVMEECKSLISELGITLFHTLRQGNNCADHLAKLGRMQQEELVIIHRPPRSMQQLLLADMAHVAYPRFITSGASAVGAAYGTLLASWDPEKQGSFIGLEEAQKNWVDMWAEDGADDEEENRWIN